MHLFGPHLRHPPPSAQLLHCCLLCLFLAHNFRPSPYRLTPSSWQHTACIAYPLRCLESLFLSFYIICVTTVSGFFFIEHLLSRWSFPVIVPFLHLQWFFRTDSKGAIWSGFNSGLLVSGARLFNCSVPYYFSYHGWVPLPEPGFPS